MLWDDKSKGIVNTVVNRSRDHKPVVVRRADRAISHNQGL
jgi:hypothetical protein